MVKKMLAQENSDLALLNYQATPHSTTGVSPAEALMGRQFKTRLPILPRNLSPRMPSHQALRSADIAAKIRYKYQYDRRHGARELEPLTPGESVLLKTDEENQWSKSGQVVLADPDNRTYMVDTPQELLRPNRNHIQSVPPPSDRGADPVERDAVPEPTLELLTESVPQTPQSPAVIPRSSGRIIQKPLRYRDK